MHGQAPAPHLIEERLARAEAICARRGARLTKLRRDVLALILASPEPVGAYALLDRLRESGGNGQPPTVYRALDFLLAQGLVHRLEGRQAFVGCHDAAPHDHPAQFLLCAGCGRAEEIDDPGIAAAVAQAASRQGFGPRRATVEIDGVCVDCAALSGSDTGDSSTSLPDGRAHTTRSH